MISQLTQVCYRRWRRLRSVPAVGESKWLHSEPTVADRREARSTPSPNTSCPFGHPFRVRFSRVQYRGYAKARAPVIERWRLQRHLTYKILNRGQLLYHCLYLLYKMPILYIEYLNRHDFFFFGYKKWGRCDGNLFLLCDFWYMWLAKYYIWKIISEKCADFLGITIKSS